MKNEQSEIIVYQPNETMRMKVRLMNESIWLSQQEIADLFGVQKAAISKHLKNIFISGELVRESTVSKMETVHVEGARSVCREVEIFNLDAIIAVGYRVNSRRATQFRIWATGVLKRYLIEGIVVHDSGFALAKEMDRRFQEQGAQIVELRRDVDYFIRSSIPPKEKVFVDGQMLDAQVELTRIVRTAKKRIVLIDNYIDERTLMLLGNRGENVDCRVYTMSPNSPRLAPALENYAKEFPKKPIDLKGYKKSHDRFLIVDDTVWHVGASLKDAGSALFALMKMELKPEVILSLL